jgi:hypothetical protein
MGWTFIDEQENVSLGSTHLCNLRNILKSSDAIHALPL